MMGMLNQQKGRKATPEEQGAYTLVVKQVLGFLSKPEVAQQLEAMIQKVGPEKALATVIMQAIQMVGQAAKGAGKDVAMHTGMSALKEIVNVMANMLKMSGIVQDAQATAGKVLQMIQQGMKGGQQEQAPPTPMQEPAQPMMGA
jgi:hypothetical protein